MAGRENLGGYGLPLPDKGSKLPYGRQSKVAQVLSALRRIAGRARGQKPRGGVVGPPVQPPGRVPPGAGGGPPGPPPGPPPLRSEEFDRRRMMALVAQCAREKKPVRIRYRKATESNRIIFRTISPYGVRYHVSMGRGRAGYLYAACSEHGNRTHSFLVSNLDGVWETENPWGGMYMVEF